MIVDAEPNNRIPVVDRINWRAVLASLLGLAILSSVALGPTWLISYMAGLLNSGMIWILSSVSALVAWVGLLMIACLQFVRSLRGRHKMATVLWLSAAAGIVLAFALFFTGTTPSSEVFFARGIIMHLEMQTDINAIQTWVESVDPSDCLDDQHPSRRGRHLARDDQPPVLKRQTGMVDLELDARGAPSVRLTWFGGKSGTWGLVIGRRDMRTPLSGPGMYGEKHTELRPGVYFWYVEA